MRHRESGLRRADRDCSGWPRGICRQRVIVSTFSEACDFQRGMDADGCIQCTGLTSLASRCGVDWCGCGIQPINSLEPGGLEGTRELSGLGSHPPHGPTGDNPPRQVVPLWLVMSATCMHASPTQLQGTEGPVRAGPAEVGNDPCSEVYQRLDIGNITWGKGKGGSKTTRPAPARLQIYQSECPRKITQPRANIWPATSSVISAREMESAGK